MRGAIRAEVSSIEPFDALERRHRDDALAWIDSGVELCRVHKPATPPKHLVSYFALVDGDHVLLVDHKKAQLWLPTGGHVEPGEHPRATVVRELAEELGLELTETVGAPLMLTISDTVGITAGHTDVSLWYVPERRPPRTARFRCRGVLLGKVVPLRSSADFPKRSTPVTVPGKAGPASEVTPARTKFWRLPCRYRQQSPGSLFIPSGRSHTARRAPVRADRQDGRGSFVERHRAAGGSDPIRPASRQPPVGSSVGYRRR